MDEYLRCTTLLNFDHESLADLIDGREWARLPEFDRIGAIYDFVRNEVPFGYNVTDALPASRVLRDGLGQCNTKTTLLMALLRGSGVPCRFHGAAIGKALQRGVVPGLVYPVAPAEIIHSWAEVFHDGRWVGLEGVILDDRYLGGLRAGVGAGATCFLGYGAGTDDLQEPNVRWSGADTEIQATGVTRDHGVFAAPDDFYRAHGENLSGLRGVLFRNVVQPWMNRRVVQIRAGER